jgi:hypothetical protein
MSYINVGARVNGQRPATKTALRNALKAVDAADAVAFDTTAMMGPRAGDFIAATPEDIGKDKLTVTGPDPYTSRKWYATVAVNSAGKITIS